MAEPEPELVFWGVRAGEAGQADSLFLKQNFVALGWPDVGDIGTIKADREAFKVKVAEAYPDKKPGAIANNAGQLFRFVHEMKVGDIAAYPSKIDRQIHIGRIAGPYQYDSSKGHYRNLRPVKWLRSVPRTRFSQGALYEIGSAMSLAEAAFRGSTGPSHPESIPRTRPPRVRRILTAGGLNACVVRPPHRHDTQGVTTGR